MKPIVVLLTVLAACDASPGSVAPAVERADPVYAPLSGGTEVILHGAGFTPAPNRVYIGGRESPLVRTIDDGQLGVVIPPGDSPGDAEIVVLNRNGNAIATGLLHYSTPPTITSTSPARVLYTSETTRVTLTGTGFRDEGAGTVDVLIDGFRAVNVAVVSDTELMFTAPAGRALVRPTLTVLDARGTATTRRGFRYAPSEHDGLLLFPSFGVSFATFVDPVAQEIVSIPWTNGGAADHFTAVVRDDSGDYWAVNRSLRLGRLDMVNQAIENPLQISKLLPTVTRVGSEYVAIDRISRQIGKLDLTSGAFTPLAPPSTTTWGSYGIAALGDTVYYTVRDGGGVVINTVDLQTGQLGTPIPLTGTDNLHIEEMRAFKGVLYATTRTGQLVSIDPTTGVTTVLPFAFGRASAMDLFD